MKRLKRAARYVGHLVVTAAMMLIVNQLVQSLILPFLKRPTTALNNAATAVAAETVGVG